MYIICYISLSYFGVEDAADAAGPIVTSTITITIIAIIITTTITTISITTTIISCGFLSTTELSQQVFVALAPRSRYRTVKKRSAIDKPQQRCILWVVSGALCVDLYLVMVRSAS